MKTNIAILIGIALITYFLTLHFNQNAAPSINKVPDKSAVNETIETQDTIPAFTFTDINENTHASEDFAGKIIILNFWASWCAPCIKEFPNLIKAAQNYKEDVVLIALSSDLNKEAIQKFITKMEKQDVSFDAKNVLIALDENQDITAKKFQTFKLPETYVIDRKQNIRNKLIGANWDFKDLDEIIKSLN